MQFKKSVQIFGRIVWHWVFKDGRRSTAKTIFTFRDLDHFWSVYIFNFKRTSIEIVDEVVETHARLIYEVADELFEEILENELLL